MTKQTRTAMNNETKQEKELRIKRQVDKIFEGKGSDGAKMLRISKIYDDNYVASNEFRFGEY